MTIDATLLPPPIHPQTDPRAPMASAPMVYNPDNSVAWEQMWASFCQLASAGGPPHRGTLLRAQLDADPTSPSYHFAVNEIVRGIKLVGGLLAQPAHTGWIAVECGQNSKAHWLSSQILQENVESYAEGTRFFVPVGDTFTLKGEIKNVITAVAKTTHYWQEHLAPEIKTSLAWEDKFRQLRDHLRRWFPR